MLRKNWLIGSRTQTCCHKPFPPSVHVHVSLTSATTSTSTDTPTFASTSGSAPAVPSVTGTGGVVHSVTKLLEAPTQMVAKATIAQSFLILPSFTGGRRRVLINGSIRARWLGGHQNRACTS